MKRDFKKKVYIYEKKPTKETHTYLHTESWRERLMRELSMPCSVLGCWIWCVSAAPPLTPTSFCKDAAYRSLLLGIQKGFSLYHTSTTKKKKTTKKKNY